jgi:hypothetical protein
VPASVRDQLHRAAGETRLFQRCLPVEHGQLPQIAAVQPHDVEHVVVHGDPATWRGHVTALL